MRNVEIPYPEIDALLKRIRRDENGAAYNYLFKYPKVASVIDEKNRLSALFVYGLEEFELDRWLPVHFATYGLDCARAAKRALENELGTAHEFRIVRFQKNVVVE